MAFLKFSEWHSAVKAGVAVCTTFAAVIGIYIGVDAWADDKAMAAQLETLKVVAEAQVRNDMDHDKMVQSSRISRSETNITVTEMKLEQLEEDIDERQDAGREPTARQERSLTRLTKLLETYESEQLDATTKLTTITTITTTESN